MFGPSERPNRRRAGMSADRDMAEAFDLANLQPGFAEDPFPTYRALLEHAPLKR